MLYISRASGGGGVGASPPAVTGLTAWYSAESETGYADGAQITTWHDRTGNGNHATGTSIGAQPKPLWKATTGPAGGPAVLFNGNNCYFNLPNLYAGATSAEMFVKVKSDGFGCGSWAFGAGTGLSDESHYPFGDGIVYESSFLPSGSRPSFVPSLAITSWRNYNVSAGAVNYDINLDGTNQFHSGAGPFGLTFTSAPLIGRGVKSSAGDLFFSGSITTVLLFDHALSSTDRGTVNTWMAANPSGGT